MQRPSRQTLVQILHMTLDETLPDLLTRASLAKQQWLALSPKDAREYSVEKLADEIHIMALLRVLPKDFESLRSNILLQRDITLENVVTSFHRHAEQVSHEATQSAMMAH